MDQQWELVRNANSGAAPRSAESETLKVRASKLGLHNLPSDSYAS
jgi:hypothetical protein